MDRLTMLKTELAQIKGFHVLSYDLLDKCIEYYEHEIECIEKYGSPNPVYEQTKRVDVELTNEQAIIILDSAHDDFVDDYSAEFMKAYEMGMRALSGDQKECNDFVCVPKKVLKFRCKEIVAYNVEYLKKNCEREMKLLTSGNIMGE